ncbi:RNA-binding protein 26 [Cladorrhinum samala]|uniref:RNA-binding protein 26 n=1 Tax=Cladorrhinum samala TaxID=585594 RepID=A0AAV9HPW9_9PEZI|nr:RNA-binding protein 26 [Cladorrhinum samala]
MLFPEEDAPVLKQWIVKRLENTSDADADVLADYVMELLRHDGGSDAVRKLLESEVPDFLKAEKDSTVFINDVFEAMKYRTYLPNAPPRPPKAQQQSQQQLMEQLRQQLSAQQAQSQQRHNQTGLPYDDGPAMSYAQQGQQQLPYSNGPGSRKRGYHDLDNPNAQQQNVAVAGNGRTFKQARRGGAGGGRGGRYGAGGDDPNNAPEFSAPQPSAVGYFDPQRAAADFMRQMTQMSQQMEFMAQQQNHNKKKKRRCRDYEKKGYCPRGIKCNFEHTTDDFPPISMPASAAQQQRQTWDQNEEYDPSNALVPPMFGSFPNAPFIFDGSSVGFDPSQHQQQQQHPKQQRANRNGHSKRAAFSLEGPVYDKSNTTIVIEKIPEEYCEEKHVRDFFSKFGKIQEITMHPYKHLAVVKYETWEEADAAYHSPKVIFENRFVKVFWHKESDESSEKPAKNGFSNGEEDVAPAPEIDLEEFIKQQEEKQKLHEEKKKHLEEIDRKRVELEKKRLELLEEQARAKVKLIAKLANKNKSGNADGAKAEDGADSEMTQTEKLRAQLAMMEEEARGLGLDPDNLPSEENGSSYYGSEGAYTPRGGGYRGRGRGRGLGAFAPRGRGGYHGGDVHAAYAAYSLDNRPKKVVVTGVDFTEGGRDEMLRQYLFGIGEFTDIQSTPASTEIAFKDRKTAEKFFNLVVLNGNTIGQIEGQVELAWASGSGSFSAATSGFNTPGGGNKNEDQEEGEVDESEHNDHDHGDEDVKITLDRSHAQQGRVQELNDMDYEVADEDDQWEY